MLCLSCDSSTLSIRSTLKCSVCLLFCHCSIAPHQKISKNVSDPFSPSSGVRQNKCLCYVLWRQSWCMLGGREGADIKPKLISPPEALNPDRSFSQRKSFSMAEIYNSSVFPYEGSHSYALHLNTYASRELFTISSLTAQLIWEATLQAG